VASSINPALDPSAVLLARKCHAWKLVLIARESSRLRSCCVCVRVRKGAVNRKEDIPQRAREILALFNRRVGRGRPRTRREAKAEYDFLPNRSRSRWHETLKGRHSGLLGRKRKKKKKDRILRARFIRLLTHIPLGPAWICEKKLFSQKRQIIPDSLSRACDVMLVPV